MRDLKQALQTSHNPHHLLFSLINSFRIYNCEPTPQAYHFLIQTLTNNSLLRHLPPVLYHLENMEKFETPESIFAHLIQIYGRANQIHDALDLFYRVPMFRCVPSVYLLNTLLSVLFSTSEGLKLVPQVLLKSRAMNIRLEDSTFLLLIEALCRIKKVGYAVEIFHSMLNDGFCIDTKICSLLLSSLCEQVEVSNNVEVMGFLGELMRLGFCPGMVDYTNIIRFLVRRRMGMDAFDVLNQMKSDGIKPDIVCYTMVLDGLIEKGSYSKADEVFDELLVYGLIPDFYTYSVYIKGLCKQGNIEAGIKMVASMEELGCQPNCITYNILLNALFKSGEISRGWEVVREMRSKGIELGLETYKIMIDGLISNGNIIEACALLEECLDKDLWTESLRFDRIICGLCQVSARDKAFELVERMVCKNMFPGVRAWEALVVGYSYNVQRIQY
ncbi:pentatricopeptide repeat-containing protein At2g38420, mitochondrial [Euphorbia lathyris]|uniref:pentatricopeptide repeat-containing protein At2g38420, mitochondrial n=1 Tax=Euphorbia lathyris TaxID=212925 RepID=UPI0033138E66